MTLLLMAARDTIFVHTLVVGICHDHLDSFEVLGRGPNSLDKLQIFALHILVTLQKLVVLESQLEYFLASGALSLRRFLPVLLVHIEACFSLCRR